MSCCNWKVAWRQGSCPLACGVEREEGGEGTHSEVQLWGSLGCRGEERMEVGQLQRRWLDLTNALFCEGILDEQFTQLQQLQDESNPDFVFEVVSLFFQDSEKLLADLGRVLDQQVVDFQKVDAHVHQLKGSSASIGAQRVKNVCLSFRNYCQEGNREGCLRCLQQVKQECSLVKSKLDTLFKLEQQILAAGGSIPII